MHSDEGLLYSCAQFLKQDVPFWSSHNETDIVFSFSQMFWNSRFKKSHCSHRIHCETGSVKVVRTSQPLQLIVNSVAFSGKKIILVWCAKTQDTCSGHLFLTDCINTNLSPYGHFSPAACELIQRTYSSFHFHTSSTNFSLPRSCLDRFRSFFSFFSTTTCVAIPA